jgi:hypothetical protein
MPYWGPRDRQVGRQAGTPLLKRDSAIGIHCPVAKRNFGARFFVLSVLGGRGIQSNVRSKNSVSVPLLQITNSARQECAGSLREVYTQTRALYDFLRSLGERQTNPLGHSRFAATPNSALFRPV